MILKGIAPATTILLMNAELHKRIGANIRRIRLQRCMFVELVAERLGKPADYVRAIEQGENWWHLDFREGAGVRFERYSWIINDRASFNLFCLQMQFIWSKTFLLVRSVFQVAWETGLFLCASANEIVVRTVNALPGVSDVSSMYFNLFVIELQKPLAT